MKKSLPIGVVLAAALFLNALTSANAEDAWLESQTRAPGARQTLTIAGTEYAFRWVPAGTFVMGSPEDEPGRDSDEDRHEIMLTHGFWIMETEVTQALWQAIMGDNPSRFRGDNLPVERVAWDDCRRFVAALNELNLAPGAAFRLPTEAEWEYACRAGKSGAYEGEELAEVGWFRDNSDGQTHEVGQKKANAWGLFDMHGNVWEWCEDRFDRDYYKESPAVSPTGPEKLASRVVRGGGWYYKACRNRAAARSCYAPDLGADVVGLRLVLGPAE